MIIGKQDFSKRYSSNLITKVSRFECMGITYLDSMTYDYKDKVITDIIFVVDEESDIKFISDQVSVLSKQMHADLSNIYIDKAHDQIFVTFSFIV